MKTRELKEKYITRSNNQTYISILCKGSYKRICVIFTVALKFLVKLAQNKVVVDGNSFSLRVRTVSKKTCDIGHV